MSISTVIRRSELVVLLPFWLAIWIVTGRGTSTWTSTLGIAWEEFRAVWRETETA
jgi:hypothetical protein